jgi:membrane-associated protein
MEPITGIAIVDWFLVLLNTYGYLLVFGFTVFENLFVIGSFTPGETVVMAAAFLSTPSQGSLSLPLVWVMSVLGTTAGANISYWVGRVGGRETVLRLGKRFRVREEHMSAAEEYFFTHGSKTVFLSRFAAGFKNIVPMIAGASKMHLAYFEAWVLLGAITYTSIMCAIGYFVGENFDRALQIAAQVGYVGMALFLILVAVLIRARRERAKRRIEELAEEREYVTGAFEAVDVEIGAPGRGREDDPEQTPADHDPARS